MPLSINASRLSRVINLTAGIIECLLFPITAATIDRGDAIRLGGDRIVIWIWDWRREPYPNPQNGEIIDRLIICNNVASSKGRKRGGRRGTGWPDRRAAPEDRCLSSLFAALSSYANHPPSFSPSLCSTVCNHISVPFPHRTLTTLSTRRLRVNLSGGKADRILSLSASTFV